jgi:nitrite reductase (NADH) large subunit
MVAGSTKQKLVMVGNGMAGVRTLEHLLEYAPERYDITVFGAEPFGNYNRILLSPVLASEKTFDEIMLNGLDWYRDNNITLHSGHRIVAINRRRQTVTADNGLEVPYDRLLLATGSNPFILPIPGVELEGVVAYRDIFDVRKMLEAARTRRNAVVIGGGLLGLEAASGLRKQGMEVTVVHACDTLMERQLDGIGGLYLRRQLEKSGIRFLMPRITKRVLADTTDAGHVSGLQFEDGSTVAAELVVMAVGIRPNTELARKAGLYCERGIVVDDTLQTFDPSIYAVGECAQHKDVIYGLVAPLYDQAKVCASHLAGHGVRAYYGTLLSTRLKVTGIDMFSAGDFNSADGSEILTCEDPARGIYRKLVLKNDRIQGAILYGDVRDSGWYFELMQSKESVAGIRERLIFGKQFISLPKTPETSGRAMAVDVPVLAA